MQAYEFYATPENGVIKIPEQYKDKITSGVKVILLEEKDRIKKIEDGQEKSPQFLPPVYKTKGWKFNRDEANER